METDGTEQHLKECVDECLSGSVHGFGPIVEHFNVPVFNYIYRMTGSSEDTEDICQETFLAAYRYLHTFKRELKLSTWLFTIAHNAVARYLRKKSAAGIPVEPGRLDRFGTAGTAATQGTAGAPVSRRPGGESNLPRGMDTLSDLIDRAIERLPPVEREIMVLHYIEELSYQEISEVLQLTEPQIRMRLYRARKKIRAKLNPIKT